MGGMLRFMMALHRRNGARHTVVSRFRSANDKDVGLTTTPSHWPKDYIARFPMRRHNIRPSAVIGVEEFRITL